MELGMQVQILDETVWILLHANAFENGMNPTILLQAMVNKEEDCVL